MAASIDRTNGGMVTVTAGQWETVIINPAKTYWLLDTGFDSDGAAQTSAKLFYVTDGTEPTVGFANESNVGYVRQSTSTYQPAVPIFNCGILKLGSTGAETTAMLIVDPLRGR